MKCVFKVLVLLVSLYLGYWCFSAPNADSSDIKKLEAKNVKIETQSNPNVVKTHKQNTMERVEIRRQRTENNTRRKVFEGEKTFRNELLNKSNPFEIRHLPPYLPDYRNPCWLDENHVLRCFPYFLLIGMMKCGTTDLYQRLAVHPRIITPNNRRWEIETARLRLDPKEARWKALRWKYKEPHFWAGHWRKKTTVADYVSLFDEAAKAINATLMKNSKTGKTFHATVTFDASTTTFWENSDWELSPDNAGLTEPRYINPHYVRHVLPDAKLILILRNPVERLYSELKHRVRLEHRFEEQPNISLAFHAVARSEIKDWEKCVSEKSFKQCLYSSARKLSIRRGMYAYFLADWLDLFPREQIAIIKFEEYIVDPLAKLKGIYKFLGLDALPVQLEDHVVNYQIENEGDDKTPMSANTRHMLTEFYTQYNQQLASLLKDDRFLWRDS